MKDRTNDNLDFSERRYLWTSSTAGRERENTTEERDTKEKSNGSSISHKTENALFYLRFKTRWIKLEVNGGSVTQFISVLQLVKTQLAPGLCAARKKTNWKKQYRETATDNLVCEGRFHCLHLADRERFASAVQKPGRTNRKSEIRDEFCRRNRIARVFLDRWLIQTREPRMCSGRDRPVEKNPIFGRVIGVST